MPLLSVNASDDDVRDLRGADPQPALARLAAGLAPGRPAVIMIHGFKFSPTSPAHSPHSHILGDAPGQRHWKALPWPRHLGLSGRAAPDGGLGIGFGWEARGSIWRAYGAAARAGAALAALVLRLRRVHAGPVTVIAHSLGARVALSALPLLPGGAIDRMLFLAGADFRDNARAARDSAGGRAVEVVNVTSGENDVFDVLLERALARRPGSALGARGLKDARWCDAALDDPATLAALNRLGYPIPGPQTRLCHWSLYLRPGVFALYRDLLSGRDALPMPLLLARLPQGAAPRWSRLLALPARGAALPSLENAAS